MKWETHVLGEFGSIYVSRFTNLYDVAGFAPLLYYAALESFILVKLVKK